MSREARPSANTHCLNPDSGDGNRVFVFQSSIQQVNRKIYPMNKINYHLNKPFDLCVTGISKKLYINVK